MKSFIIVLFGILFFQAANADEFRQTYIDKGRFVDKKANILNLDRDSILITEITDAAISSTMQTAFQNLHVDWSALASSLGLRSIVEGDIDFVNLKKATVINDLVRNPMIAYVAYFHSYDPRSTTNYAYAMYTSASGLAKPTIVKVESGVVKYFFLDDDVVINFANVRNVVQVSNSFGGFNVAGRAAGCGGAVAGCVADVYSNHEWLSVWAFVQTAYLPATAVAMVVACTAKNCFD